MDAKLKALKVADLKAVLAKADVPAPARAPKPDLVARILASQPALDAYAALYPADDLLAPPEEVDWDAEPAQPPPPSPTKPAAAAPSTATAPSMPEPAPTTAPAASEADPASAPPADTVDPELEKRKARAARFGIPIVESSKLKPVKTKPAPAGVDPKKLEERATRFGIKPKEPQPAAAAPDPAKRRRGEKRAAPPAQEVDEEELARRKKRAERFGVPVKP